MNMPTEHVTKALKAFEALDTTEIAHSHSSRPRYSREQLDTYFAAIKLPAAHLSSPLLKDPLLARTYIHGFPFLSALILHHLATVPFENLELHYSPYRNVSLDAEELYVRMVERGERRGGQCMQLNGLFGTVLRSLGFDVMSTAGRVNTACQAVARTPGYRGPSYNGW